MRSTNNTRNKSRRQVEANSQYKKRMKAWGFMQTRRLFYSVKHLDQLYKCCFFIREYLYIIYKCTAIYSVVTFTIKNILANAFGKTPELSLDYFF